MQPCFVSVWRAEALEPNARRFELLEPTPIGRELLEVSDGSVSRAAHAPWLEPRGPIEAGLHVPARSANAVLVIHDCDFGGLSRGLGKQHKWPIAPGGLRRRSALVLGERSSLALLRSHTDGTDHLISLPHAERVLPGQSTTVATPALLVVGAGAVCLTPGETILPNSARDLLPAPLSFRLPNTGVTFAAARELDGFLAAPVPDTIRLGGLAESCRGRDLPRVARELLSSLRIHDAFLPALVDERAPRLVFLYERQDQTVRALISDGPIEEWLSDIAATIAAADRPDHAAPPVTPSLKRDDAPSDDATLETEVTAERSLTEPVTFGAVSTFVPEFAAVLSKLASVADRDLTVLLLGESGTGKEHLARALHSASPRRAAPFVAVNCSLLSESMVGAELFGHKKGAFSDAHADREGLFQSAHGGTLLLDEIGDAPLHVQYALLRALQERAVRPVGGTREEPVDVRVIAATSRDVPQLIQEKRLREDLYYRLAELTVTLPPLRERLPDLPLIADSLLTGLGCEKLLTQSALTRLKRHDWPGNIRELKNALHRAYAASGENRTLGAALFDDLDALRLPPRRDPPPFEFPDVVRGLGAHAATEQALPPLPMKSQYEQRALQRATLLYLSELYATLPAPFMVPWERLFGPRWATTENGRGLKDVLRVLGRTATDKAAREWVRKRAG